MNNDIFGTSPLAVALDFDGTVTEKGVPYPTVEMASLIAKVAYKMPLAFCTGRDFSSFEVHGLANILQDIDEKEHEHFLKNIFILADNGAVGYFFDQNKAKFEIFYKIKWPTEVIAKPKLIKILEKSVEGFGDVLNKHEIPIVTRPVLNEENLHKSNIKEVYECSDQIYFAYKQTLENMFDNYTKHFYLGNSGIGVILGPINGNKDTGIEKFTEYLRENRGLNIGNEAREIVCIGDRPLPGGNDYFLLNGKYGNPFTVGDRDESKKYPAPVYDEKGKRLLNEAGTAFILNKLLNLN